MHINTPNQLTFGGINMEVRIQQVICINLNVEEAKAIYANLQCVIRPNKITIDLIKQLELEAGIDLL